VERRVIRKRPLKKRKRNDGKREKKGGEKRNKGGVNEAGPTEGTFGGVVSIRNAPEIRRSSLRRVFVKVSEKSGATEAR